MTGALHHIRIAVLGLASLSLLWTLLFLLNLDNVRAMRADPPLGSVDVKAIILRQAAPTTMGFAQCLAEHGHGLSAYVLNSIAAMPVDALRSGIRRAQDAYYLGEAAILIALSERAQSVPVSYLDVARQYLVLPWVGAPPWAGCERRTK